MQHELRGRPLVPPPLWRLQRVSERHHAEWEEPAELRPVRPQVRMPLQGTTEEVRESEVTETAAVLAGTTA